MDQYLFEGSYKKLKTGVIVKLLLFSFEDEKKVSFIYSPHLDLTGYGHSVKEAMESFNLVFDDFIDYTLKKKTLSKVLSNLGWQVTGTTRKPKKVIAPSITSVIRDNAFISEIFDKYPVQTFHQEVGLPVSA